MSQGVSDYSLRRNLVKMDETACGRYQFLLLRNLTAMEARTRSRLKMER